MSVKPEITVTCLKESRQYQGAKCPIGTFIVRLYWKDYSQYVRNERKLDGVYLLKDSKNIYHRTCEFAVTSLQSLEYLLSNCDKAGGIKGKWFQRQTEYAVMKFRGFAQTAYEFVKPIKAAVTQAKETVSKVAKSVFRRFDPRQPQSFAKCETIDQAKYLFDRCPESQRTQKFIDNYLATCDRITEALAVPVPQYGLTLDDVAPPLVEQPPELIEHIPATDSQVRQMMADGYKSNARRCKQWIIGVGKSIPDFQVIVKATDKRNAEKIMQQVIENILLAQLSASQLRDIIASS
jgi:hypothetical protein